MKMNRPLVFFAISMILGIICAFCTKSYVFILACTGIILSANIVAVVRFRSSAFFQIGILLFFLIGGILFLIKDSTVKNKYVDYDQKEVIIRGFVKSEVEKGGNWNRCIIEVSEIGLWGKGQFHMKKLKGKVIGSLPENHDFPRYGQGIEVKGTLALPKEKRNPGGFDYRSYLVQKNISAILYINQEGITEIPTWSGNNIKKIGLLLRNRIINVIENCLPPQQAGLLNGMLIGYREGLSENVEEAFRNAGLTHIMAVSGANVAFIAAPILFLLKKLHVSRNISCLITIICLIIFMSITGFEASVARAVTMACVILAGKIIKREPEIFTSISFAALVLLIYNPHMLFNVGFQLSFAATLSLVLFMKNAKYVLENKFRVPGLISDTLASTVTAQAGVLPITVYNFNMISLVSVVSNLLVVPLTGVVTILGMIMAVLGQFSLSLAQITGYVNCLILTLILYITKISSALPWSTVRVPSPKLWLIVLYYLLLVFFMKGLFVVKHHRLKISAYVLVLAFFVTVVATCLLPWKLKIVFLDVGYGDAVFIRTAAGRTILVDGGERNEARNKDMGKQVIIPFLLHEGITELDMVVATHSHNDHTGGLCSVLEYFSVKRLILPGGREEEEFKSLMDICRKKNIEVIHLFQEDLIRPDRNTVITVFNPSVRMGYQNSPLNNGSLVLKLCYGDVSVLLTGDIEKEAESFLLGSGVPLGSDIIKAAHHGSDTSSTAEFIEAVGPKLAVISVGRNHFGHPEDDVIKRFYNIGAKVYRTDINGAVLLTSDGKKIRLRGMVS